MDVDGEPTLFLCGGMERLVRTAAALAASEPWDGQLAADHVARVLSDAEAAAAADRKSVVEGKIAYV